MKKISILALSLIAAVGFTPLAAQAANAAPAYNQGQGRKIIVQQVNPSNINEIKDKLNSLGINIGNLNPGNCPNVNIPGVNQPKPENPDNNKPENPDNTPPGNPDNNIPGNPGDNNTDDSFAKQVVKLVNEERTKNGLAPLTIDQNAEKAALVRAKETEISFSHTRPNGSSFSTALTESGASFRGSGENIAYGQKTPEQVMQGWMNSSGHRANILNANYKSIGVGHYQNASGVSYWTQLFMY